MIRDSHPSEIQWRCLKCLKVHDDPISPDSVAPLSCSDCGAPAADIPRRFKADGTPAACPACGCPDLYRQRDFNRRLGLAIVIAGIALAPFTYYLSIIVFLLIDVAIYYRVSDIIICYHCHAILRNYPGTDITPIFDLNTSDKYIDVERKRGW